MKKKLSLVVATVVGCSFFAARATASDITPLSEDWQIQSIGQVPESGMVISTTDFKPEHWYSATVPSTVAGALVDDHIYPDPFNSMNLKDLSTNAAFKGPCWNRK
jgi:hypothetical protein